MWWWLVAIAWSGVPADVDLEAVEMWDDASQDLRKGPDGCWDLVGVASWNWDLGRFAEYRGTAAFAGRLKDHVWVDFHLEPLGEVSRNGPKAEALKRYEAAQRFAPLFGRLYGGRASVSDDGVETEVDKGSSPGNLLVSAMDELSGDTATAWTTWDDDAKAVILHEALPTTKKAEILVTTSFPNGDSVPVAQDFDFPDRFPVGAGLLTAWVHDGEAHLRGRAHNGQVFPEMEAFSFRARAAGFAFSGAQTVVYQHIKACPD
jgi:hypothetical protein